MKVAEFESLMETVGNMYVNRKGVEIDVTDQISAAVQLWAKAPTIFSLYVELDTDDFLRELGIKDWAHVDAIDEALLWDQYMKGNGYVWADMDYLCTGGLIFRAFEGKTLVEGDMFAYHDQLDKLLDDISALRGYVREHIQELYVAAEQSEMA